MLKRKVVSYSLTSDLTDQIKWNNRSAFIEASLVYILSKMKQDPTIEQELREINEKRQDYYK